MLAHSEHNSSGAWDTTFRPGTIEKGPAAFGMEAVAVRCQRLEEFPHAVSGVLRRLEVWSHVSHRLGTLRANAILGRPAEHLPATEASPMTGEVVTLLPAGEFVLSGHSIARKAYPYLSSASFCCR